MKVVIVGGLVPAILWAITGIFQKLSAQHGTPPTIYLAVFGLVIFTLGILSTLIPTGEKISLPGVSFAALAGITFALGTGAISFALWRYNAPISKLTPILNSNVLITVVIALLFLKEASTVNPWQLIIGSVLAAVGATVAASA